MSLKSKKQVPIVENFSVPDPGYYYNNEKDTCFKKKLKK